MVSRQLLPPLVCHLERHHLLVRLLVLSVERVQVRLQLMRALVCRVQPLHQLLSLDLSLHLRLPRVHQLLVLGVRLFLGRKCLLLRLERTLLKVQLLVLQVEHLLLDRCLQTLIGSSRTRAG